MDWRAHVRERLPRLDVAPAREIEIIEELSSQLEATYERERAGGTPVDEAIRRANAEVPDWAALARTLKSIEKPYTPAPVAGATSGGIMTGLVQDVRYALRGLARAPGFATISILTLALGIAATTIVYSIVDGILLRPLPISDGDRVVLVRELMPNGGENSVSWPNFRDWLERATSYEQLAVWRGTTSNLTGFGEPRRLMVRLVSANLFSTLGVKPILGRDLTADDDRFGVSRVALVSYAFWQQELSGAESAIGRQITLDDVPVTVVGVLPASFTVARVEDVFLPWGTYLDPKSYVMGRGNHFGLAGIGRLKPGATVESANAEIVTIARQLEQEYPGTNSGNSAIVRPLFEVLVSDARPMLLVLLGAVIAMLLIACVNLANLTLARAAGRMQELAVRRSLGAARWRLARQMLTESVLLAIAGGVAGTALAYAGFETLVALLPPNQPRIHIVAINLRVLTVTAAISIATGILFGLVPAIQAATGRSMSLLRTARVAGSSSAGSGTRRALLFSEVALALVLLTGAGLMLRTMNNLLSIDTGITREQVVSASFFLPQRYDNERTLVFMDEAVTRLKAIPGAANAAFTYSLPVSGSNWNSIFIIEGQPVPERSQLPNSAWTPVSNAYFDTMGVRLLRGRWFESTDRTSAPAVVIVNQTFARRFFGDNDPIGARVKQGWPEDKTPWRQIVGVVNDVKVSGLTGDPRLQVYMPLAQNSVRAGAFVVRAAGDAASIARSIEAAVHQVDPTLPLFGLETMDDIVIAGIGNQRLTMVLLMGFAGLSLLMAAIGVFGVTAYSVTQRRHELGVRMALGAHPSSVLALVLRQEMAACLIGVAVGAAGAVFLSSLLESLLYGIAARDAATMASAALVLLAVTLIACLIPARRATRVDPAIALRME